MSMRIHPTDDLNKRVHQQQQEEEEEAVEDRVKRLTVWKRSSMSFHCTDGFTVFDERGRLVFRVDNYSRNRCSDVLLLMDGVGNALLTLKPQTQMGLLGLQSQWNAYRGEDASGAGRIKSLSRCCRVFSMRSSRSSLFSQREKDEVAVVFMHKEAVGVNADRQHQIKPDFRIRGSFWTRSCKITAATGQMAATLGRKKVNSRVLLGDDVLSLVVQPGFDAQLIMAFLVVLDRISTKPFSPLLCS